MISGATGLACMLLDVLSGFDELELCTQYRLPDGSISDRFIPDAERLSKVEAIYETLPGWTEEIDEATDRAGLPANARRYLDRIEDVVGVPIEIVSVGPERTQTLLAV
jgi:adenylosuccinate synthase